MQASLLHEALSRQEGLVSTLLLLQGLGASGPLMDRITEQAEVSQRHLDYTVKRVERALLEASKVGQSP